MYTGEGYSKLDAYTDAYIESLGYLKLVPKQKAQLYGRKITAIREGNTVHEATVEFRKIIVEMKKDIEKYQCQK